MKWVAEQIRHANKTYRVMLKDNIIFFKQKYPSQAFILTASFRGLGLFEHCNHEGLL